MKPEHSKMEYVRLTMEEYQALVEENKKLKDDYIIDLEDENEELKECLRKAIDCIEDISAYCHDKDCCKHCNKDWFRCCDDDDFRWQYAGRVKELLK